MHYCSGCLCHAKPLTLIPLFNILQISNCWKFGKERVAKISKYHQTTCEHRTSFQVDLLFCRWFQRKTSHFPSVLDKKVPIIAHQKTDSLADCMVAACKMMCLETSFDSLTDKKIWLYFTSNFQEMYVNMCTQSLSRAHQNVIKNLYLILKWWPIALINQISRFKSVF